MTQRNYPKVGLAFSGASSRSVFYVGFLEVLKENEFPIDYIAAMSGAAVVAAGYACGSLDEVKSLALKLDKEVIFSLIERSKGRGGFYQMNKVEEMLRVYTKNLNFEDVTPKLGFVATDIINGEEVVLQVGDIARAICASCTLPGIFEPVAWGNKSLVDGGIMNIVPGDVAQAAGCDVVIGIDMRATRHVFSPWQIVLKKYINAVKRVLWPSQMDELWQRMSNMLDYTYLFDAYPKVEQWEDKQLYPNLFGVLGRSLDLAIEAQHKQQDPNFNCDLLIVPETPTIPFWKKYLFMHFTDFTHTEDLYLAGRTTAKQYLPQLWQLLARKQEEQVKVKEKLHSLFNE